MSNTFEVTGGARVGGMSASWPFAKLKATPAGLQVNVWVLGDFTFAPESVVSITPYTLIPLLAWGIKIRHCVPDYPDRFVFMSFGRPVSLLAGIHGSGFKALAIASEPPPKRGIAVRWQAIAIILVIWNGLFACDLLSTGRPASVPGPYSLAAIGLVFLGTLLTNLMPGFQNLLLKPGRKLAEIQGYVNLLMLIAGIMFVGFALSLVFHVTPS